jgi:UDP-N-acetylmuramate--alanine ligase
MSGLAEILVSQGFSVSGSDLNDGLVCERLRSVGITVSVGHNSENVSSKCSALVYSSAITPDNPEVIRARELEIPVVRRAEVLAELMRLKHGIAVAGSHGKTTTTSMLAAILNEAQLDPTVVIGGVVKGSASGGRLGQGEFLVAESDESDRSFLLLRPTIAVVTNIDAEHLSAYASLQELEQCFEQFLQSVPFYGIGVVCTDDPRLKAIRTRLRSRVVCYGSDSDADLTFRDIHQKGGVCSFTVVNRGLELGRVELAMAGRHFALNALAAIAVALELAIPFEVIQQGLAGFRGVGRRIEFFGKEHGVSIIDDYGHHPTEIRSTVQAVRDNWCQEERKLHVVFQPHRYSRTEQCFDDFVEVLSGLESLFMLPIYSAGENAIEGISSEALSNAIKLRADSDAQVVLLESIPSARDALVSMVENGVIQAGDCVLCLGAGSISGLAGELKRAFASVEPGNSNALTSSTVVHLHDSEGNTAQLATS